MTPLISGLVVLVIGCAAFWYSLPRHGKPSRFVGTVLEPYVTTTICAIIAVSVVLIASGVAAVMQGR